MIMEWRQALRNLLRNKRRSLVTGLAIMTGFTGLGLFGGYVARIERYCMVNFAYLNHIGHVQVYRKNGLDKYYSKPSRYLIDEKTQATLRKILAPFKEIEFTSPYLMANGLIQGDGESFVFQGKGLTKEADRFVREHPLVKKWNAELQDQSDGTPLSDSSESNPVKITFTLSEFLKNKKEVNLQGLTVNNDFNALHAKVTARYTTGVKLNEDTSMMTTVGVFQELMATDGITYLGIYLKDDGKARKVAQILNEKFQQSELPLEAHSFFEEEVGQYYFGTMNFLFGISTLFFILVSLVVILSVSNAISMNIMERVKELGTMRAIGFTPSRIAALIAKESFILSLISIAIGFVLTQVIASLVNASNIRFSPPGTSGDIQFILTPWPEICLGLALPLLLFATTAAYFVSRSKLKGEVAHLLIETTT
jgi:putative ABC transport system permease protein